MNRASVNLARSAVDPATGDARWRRLALAGLVLTILGAKILLIARLGVPTPYWDQWDGDAAGLYLPFLEGRLDAAHWLAFHNEHRILLTRASTLALMLLTGTWDPIVQMLFNALVHVAAIGLLIALLGRLLDLAGFLLFAAFALLLLAVPFGWDNTLGGFQVQFYYLILLSALALHLAAHAPAWTPRWLAGSAIAVAGYLSMASGALILPAAVALAAAQLAVGRRSGARELAGLALHAIVAAVLLHDALQASPHGPASIGAAISSSLVSASWPVAAASWPAPLRVIPALLINAPVLLLALRVLRDRPGLDDRRWLALALAGWVALQLAALSYGRPGGTPESRYNDIFVIGIVLNGASLLALLRALPQRRLFAFATVWVLAVMLGAGQKATSNVVDGIAARVRTGQIQTENVKSFVATGDFSHLAGKPHLHIPFPSPDRLRDLLLDERVRAILPPALTGAPESRVKALILTQGPMLLPLGLALLMLAGMQCLRLRPAPPGRIGGAGTGPCRPA